MDNAPKHEDRTMTATSQTWEVEQADFRRTAFRPITHKGERWLMAECQELIAGRWEGFVSMKRAPAAR